MVQHICKLFVGTQCASEERPGHMAIFFFLSFVFRLPSNSTRGIYEILFTSSEDTSSPVMVSFLFFIKRFSPSLSSTAYSKV